MIFLLLLDRPQFVTEDSGTLEGQLTATDIDLSRGDDAGKTPFYRLIL